MNELNTEQMQELVALYALGALGQHEARLLESCKSPEVADDLAATEELIGHLALDAQAACPAAELRDRLMERIAAEARPREDGSSGGRIETTIAHVRGDEGDWMPFADRISLKLLLRNQATDRATFLLRLEPGAVIPRHRHSGVEECYVLEGDFHIGSESYGPGDYQYALPGSFHDRVYTRDGALVLITAPSDYVHA